MYAGLVPLDDWGLCDGAEVKRSKYLRLFELIGVRFGRGYGETTFNLPTSIAPVRVFAISSAWVEICRPRRNAVGSPYPKIL
ncbi:MAG: phage tail protein [Chloroflexota bacterium]